MSRPLASPAHYAPRPWGAAGRVVGTCLIVLGLGLLSLTGLYYAYGVYQLSQFGAQPPAFGVPSALPGDPPPFFEATAPTDAAAASVAAPATRVRIPAIDVDAPAVELGTVYNEKGELVWETAKHAVGHHIGTANPGEPGNVVMSGHISSPVRGEGNVFSRLPDVQPGATVFVETAEGSHEYRVTERRLVEPSQVSVMAPTEQPLLTLITCFPDWIYTHRLVVTAEAVGFSPH